MRWKSIIRNENYNIKLSIAYNYLPLFVLVISSFTIAFLYNQRLTSKIFKNDIYLIWITGSISWLYILLKCSLLIEYLGKMVFISLAYILLLCIFNSFPDENSVHALITIVSLIGIIWYLRAIINVSNRIPITIILLMSYFIQVLLGYIQAVEYNWDNLSINGQFYNSGFFGNYLASMLPLILSGVTSKLNLNRYLRIGFLIAFLSVSLLIVFTNARAAIIGSTIGSLFVLFSFSKKIARKNLINLFITSTIIFFVLIIGLYQIKPASAAGRLTIYRISLNIIKDYPITGVGPNRFSAVYNNYQSEYFKKEQAPLQKQLLADNTFEAFNSLLQIVVEYGIIGCFIFVVVIYQMMKLQNSLFEYQNNWLRIGSIGSIISIFFCSMFSNPFHVTPILLIIAFHISILFPLQKKVVVNNPQKKTLKVVIGIIFLALLSYFITRYHRAETWWFKASESAKYDSFAEAKITYENAYSTLKYNGDFLYNYGTEATLAGDYKLAITLLEDAKKYSSFSNLFLFLGDSYSATNQYTLAEKNYLSAIYISPSRIYPKFQLIQLYKKWNKPNMAEVWIIKTLQYPVKIKSEAADELLNLLKENSKNMDY